MKKIFLILIGSLLLAIGIDAFIIPYHLLDGGMIGIGLIVQYLWGFKTGLTIIILSLPIYIFAFFYFRAIFYNSLHGLLTSSLFIDILAPLNHSIHLPIILSAPIGGLFIGMGIGILLKLNVSTGGIDLLAQFIAQKLPINVGLIILTLDSFILFIGHRILGINVLFSAITVACVGLITTIINLQYKATRPPV
ncbi:uncharacterized membrane-anchored protein YitT (DUF2179 family) [Pullulanibacillus pueri]|uniref:YitT family protein n=1 Tax=Pullulanibacillus pueri TaxID=1437324 RepID=A0A8J3EKI4_9BACL|nr:YitT family protein [Pullulanibacillus pueri]MBM7680368.1 uncharacterized membrane-anchored protein YitT (DUF2179 family) [Pullulanibacillus pueri]GGH75420.1 hypothetical protein GCM10007096_04630 [Pullulanibacillus pueri]